VVTLSEYFAPRSWAVGIGVTLSLLVMWSGAGYAQTAPGRVESSALAVAPDLPSVITRHDDGAVTVRATRVTEPIRIDGRLDDAAYTSVAPVGPLVQQEPREGDLNSENTETWVLFDDENIYVTCRCWEAHPDQIVANELRRDITSTGQHDHLTVALDTFHDGRNGYFFLVTANGGIFDALLSDERAINGDWNTVWDFQVSRFDGGWTVEMAIPFKSLRYRPGRDQTWGLQLRRTIRHKNETTFLRRVPAAWGIGAILRLSQAATLVGLEAPPPAANLEIKPYAIGDLRTDRLARPSIANDPSADAGVDVKYGITKSLTLDLTYNTDFAQVEDDQAQVNLTRFDLFFPEKREFFLEGQGTFSFGGTGGFGRSGPNNLNVTPNLFFSRRIGLNADRAVPIIGGARLSGKLGKYNIGLLNIQTDDEAQSGARATNFTVLRLRRDILGRSMVGAMLTRRSNSLSGDGPNLAYGVDGLFTFYQFLNIAAYVAKTDSPGLKGKDLSYRGQVAWDSDRYGFEAERLEVGDNFNPEVGFMRRQDFRRNFALARFSPRPRNARVIRKYNYTGSIEYITNNQNVLESRELSGTVQVDLQSGDSATVEYTRNFEAIPLAFPISETTSIPAGAYAFENLRVAYGLGQQHRVSGTATMEAGSFYGGEKKTVSFGGRAEITLPLAIEPTVSFNWIDLPTTSLVTKLFSTRTTYAMTPRMYVSALVQYNSTRTAVSANLRFRWEYRPGSELFVVYTEGRDTFPVRRIDLENRGFVVKINRLLRL
jgi:hypothetical protein